MELRHPNQAHTALILSLCSSNFKMISEISDKGQRSPLYLWSEGESFPIHFNLSEFSSIIWWTFEELLG